MSMCIVVTLLYVILLLLLNRFFHSKKYCYEKFGQWGHQYYHQIMFGDTTLILRWFLHVTVT